MEFHGMRPFKSKWKNAIHSMGIGNDARPKREKERKKHSVDLNKFQ